MPLTVPGNGYRDRADTTVGNARRQRAVRAPPRPRPSHGHDRAGARDARGPRRPLRRLRPPRTRGQPQRPPPVARAGAGRARESVFPLLPSRIGGPSISSSEATRRLTVSAATPEDIPSLRASPARVICGSACTARNTSPASENRAWLSRRVADIGHLTHFPRSPSRFDASHDTLLTPDVADLAEPLARATIRPRTSGSPREPESPAGLIGDHYERGRHRLDNTSASSLTGRERGHRAEPRMTALLALLTVATWGVWIPLAQIVPGISQHTRTFYVTVGNLAFATLALLIGGGHLDFGWRTFWLPLAGGVLWTAGSFSAFRATESIGLARAAGTWTPLNMIVAFVWGALLFGERDNFSTAHFALLAAALMLILIGMPPIGGSRKHPRRQRTRPTRRAQPWTPRHPPTALGRRRHDTPSPPTRVGSGRAPRESCGEAIRAGAMGRRPRLEPATFHSPSASSQPARRWRGPGAPYAAELASDDRPDRSRRSIRDRQPRAPRPDPTRGHRCRLHHRPTKPPRQRKRSASGSPKCHNQAHAQREPP